MRHLLIMLLFATSCDSATAQQEPRRVKTETIRESAPGLQTLHAIDPDGTVRIDWDAVETLSISKADRTALPIAQLMLAIRDGTWKPLR